MRYEGNIFRPPGEWRSYLLQCTIGCSHNKCTFCGMYKDKSFRMRKLEEILQDIEIAREYYGPDLRRVFLCDGDAIVMRQQDLLTVLGALNKAFPNLERITTYAGPKSSLSKTPEQLRELVAAGLTRCYLGVESGSDEVLQKTQKGCTVEEMLAAGTLLRESGMDVWAIIIVGLAGKGEESRKHALATAELINKMRPRHLSALTYMPDPGTPMYDDVQAGRFSLLTANEVLQEIRLLVDNISSGPLHFTSDHASNYLAIKGTLPDDKQQIISGIDQALAGKMRLRSDNMRGL